MDPLARARSACITIASEALEKYNAATRAGNTAEASGHWEARRAAFACEKRIAAIIAEAACEHDWDVKSLFERTCRRCGMSG